MKNPSPLEAIFFAALEMGSPQERAAYLDQTCASDPVLRREVEKMLAAQAQVGSFLEQPASRPVVTTDVSSRREGPGMVIGPYKLLEQIGEGGMGSVWLAQQTQPVQRKVALKLVRTGMDSKQITARFEAERQALALMDHPNIARVLDAGTTAGEPGGASSGSPYFIMELVKGVPITKFCDHHRLTPRQRLELFIPVCQAIQHAHQKGIIHRDIKPSNVLVAMYDDRPVPKVIDFGVAKAIGQPLTEKTLNTGFGAVVGTLEYMSPEQASFNQLDVDTRSDIYSLGVLLYELLTGSTPFGRKELEKAGMLEMLRVIREQEPTRPSTKLSTAEGLPALAAHRGTDPKRLAALMRGELDWIVMKALDKDRSRRYETASSLAMDLQRYLADEPVQACPPSVGYRLGKVLRRHRGPLAGATVVFLALVGGTAAATLGWIEARKQRTAAEINEQKALTAAETAERAKETAEAREAETSTVLGFVQDRVFGTARLGGAQGGPGHDVKLRRDLETARATVARNFAKQPLVEARLRMTLGLLFSYLGDAKIGLEEYERARTLFTRLYGPDHHDTLRSRMGQALSYRALGRYTEALTLQEDTLSRLKAMLGTEHPDTLASMHNLAEIYATLGRHADAFKLRKKTLDLMKAHLGTDHPDTLMGMNNLGISCYALGRYPEALRLFEEALSRKKATLGIDHPGTFTSMGNLANIYFAVGRHADARELREKTLALLTAQLGASHPDTLTAMNNLAFSHAATGKLGLALPLCQETLKRRQDRLGPNHPDTAQSTGLLRLIQDALYTQKRLEAVRKIRGPVHLDTHLALRDVAEVDLAFNRVNEAESTLVEVLAGISSLKRDDEIRTYTVKLLRDCLMARQKQNPEDWKTFNARSVLGGALLDQQKYADAEPLLRAGYEGLKQRRDRIPAALRRACLSAALQRLIALYETTGNKDEAAKWRKESTATMAEKD
jgi:serine/threonine protein kinase/tetratricopeptide (TPR) repeat protein